MLGRNTESRQIISTNLRSCCGLRLFLLLEPVPLAETDVRGGDPVRELDPNTQLCPAHSLHHLRSVHVGPGGIARPFSTQIISVNRDVKQISVGFKKVTVEASEMTVGYMTV